MEKILRQSNLSIGTSLWSDVYIIGNGYDKTRVNISFDRFKWSLLNNYLSVKTHYFESENEKKKNDETVLLMWRMHRRERNCILQQRGFYLIWTIRIYDWVQSSADVTYWHDNIYRSKVIQNTVDKGNG